MAIPIVDFLVWLEATGVWMSWERWWFVTWVTFRSWIGFIVAVGFEIEGFEHSYLISVSEMV
jgi:hypothetical protein